MKQNYEVALTTKIASRGNEMSVFSTFMTGMLMIIVTSLSGSSVFAARNDITVGAAPVGSSSFCQGATSSGSYTDVLTLCGGNPGNTITYQWRIDGNLISGATGTFSISGSGATSQTVTVNPVPSATLSGLTVGTHTFALTFVPGNSGCNGGATITSASLVVIVKAVPTIVGTSPGSRCGTGTVVIGATASAGTIDWYAASSGGSSLGTGTLFTTPTLSTNTTYFVDATNLGCTTASRTSVLATVYSLPNINAGSGVGICAGSSTTLTATGGVGYTWSPSTGLSATTGASVTAGPSGNITYTITGTDANSCVNTATVAVTVNALPGISGGSDATICGGTTTTLTASGGATYIWSPATGLSASTGTSVDASPGSITTYTVTGTDGNGCNNTATVTVSVNLLPSIGVGSSVAICAGMSTTLMASGGVTYTWSPATGLSATTGTSVDAGPGTTTTYTVTGTDGNNCSNTATVTVTVNLLPSISGGSGVAICSGSSTTLTATGGATYAWSPATGLSATTGGSITAGPTTNTTYTVTGTDGNGCVNTGTVTVTVNALSSIALLPYTNAPLGAASCNLLYSATTGSPTTYSIAWGASALSAGFTNVSGASLPATPITVTIPGGATMGSVYTGTLTVTGSCGTSSGTAFTLAINPSEACQGWAVAGAGISAGIGVYESMVTDSNGNLYLVYSDYGHSWKTSVRRYDGSNWSTVGSPGFSAGGTASSTMAIDRSGTLYVVYTDFSNSSKATVMKYDGSSWVTVGSAGFTPGEAGFTSIAVDGSGTPYVAYQDVSNGEKASVMKYDGSSWVTVGSAGISAGVVYFTSIAIDGSGAPYVIFQDMGNSEKATVMKYDGSSWVPVGSSDVSAGTANYTSIAIDGSGTPYVTYTDVYNASKATVMKFDGSNWAAVGSTGFSAGSATYNAIAIDGNGTPYVAYKDGGNSSKATVMKYNGSNWVAVGNAGFSAGEVDFTTIALTNTGMPYVAYLDYTMGFSATIFKVANTQPAISAGNDTAICAGSSTTITASGGATYTWSPSAGLSSTTGASVIASPSVTTTYTVTGANASGCSSTATITVSINPLPSISGGSGVAICSGSSTTLTATGGATYAWSPATGLSATTGTSVDAGPSTNTTYTVTGADANGCVNAATVTVSVNVLPYVSGGPDVTICYGSTTGLTASGGSTYTWSPATGLSTTTGASVDANPSANTTYTITGTDANSCINTATVSVTVNALPIVSGGSDVAICNGSTTTLIATGGGAYTWSPATGLSATTGTSVDASPGGAITYTVTGTDGNNCSNIATVTVTVNPLPSINGGSGVAVCSGLSATLTASGGATYLWSPATGLSATTGTSVDAGPSTNTTYTVTGTDANGCVNAATVTVSVNALPYVSGGSDVTICYGSATGLTASGASTYTWYPATGLSATTGANVTAGPTANTTYTVTGTDGNGCANTAAVTVSVNVLAQPTVTSVSPYSGYPGAAITITGTNFNNTTTNNIVYFGATQAAVSTASSTSLSVAMPTGATFVPVTVINTECAFMAFSQYPFLPTYDNSAYIPGSVAFDPKVEFTTNDDPYMTAIGDIDGDGKPDVVVTNSFNTSISVYRNTSTSGSITSGSFAAKVDFATGTSPFDVIIRDLDGDGKPDIIVSNSGDNTISVFRNIASSGAITTGSLAARVDFATGSGATGLEIADIDGDGKPDIIVTNASSNTISVLRNTTTSGTINSGSFAAKVDFTTNSVPQGVAVGDIDGDGKPDIAVTNNSSGNVSVFRNTATSGVINSGSLAGKVDFTTGTNPWCIKIADIDGDGKPDLAIVNYMTSDISLLRNTATSGSITSSSFATRIDFTAGWRPIGLAVGDVDGDGKPDLFVANDWDSTVSVLRNTATSGSITTGSMAAKVDLLARRYPYGLAVGDLDGDGKPDIVVANSGADEISILRNNPPQDYAPVFTGGTPQSLFVCQNTNANSINSLLSVNDLDVAQTERWIITLAPSNGVVDTGLTVSSTGGVVTPNGFSYTPNPGYTGEDSFRVQVSDGAGGTATTRILVTVNPTPLITGSGDVAICNGSSTTVAGSGGSTYLWSPATGLSASTGGSVTASPTSTTTYTVTGSNSYGCSSSAVMTVTVNILPIISGGPDEAICAGDSKTLTASGGATYAWSPAYGLSATTGVSVTASPTVTTTYTVTGTDANSCSSTATVTITVNPLPGVGGSSGVAICKGSSTTLTASGGSTYTWSPATGLSATTGASVTASPTTTTSYTMTGTSSFGCSNTTSITVTVNTNPSPITTVGVDIITSIAGNGISGSTGDGGSATAASLSSPWDVNFDNSGNIYIADRDNHRVRKVNTSGIITKIAGTTAGYSGDGGQATAAQFNYPVGVVVDNSNNIYVADYNNQRVRKIDASGVISTIAGNGTIGYTGDGGAATAAQLYRPSALAVDGSGNLYIAEYGNYVVRKVNASGIISTVAGNGSPGFSGDGGQATAAKLAGVTGLEVDANGNILIADRTNYRVRIVNSSGIISTIAGNGSSGFSGDGGAATAALLNAPQGVTVDANGNVYISDLNNSRVRKADVYGVINTLTGNGSYSYGGDGGPATAGVINLPRNLHIDGYDNLYIADQQNNRIRKISYVAPVLAPICVGTTVALRDATTGGKWSSSDVTKATVDSVSGVVTGVSSGTPYISYVLPSGCYATVQVTVNSLPTVSGGSDTALCGSATVTLNASGGATYVWAPATGLSATTGSNITAGPSATSTYTVTGTDVNGCINVSTVTVSVNPLPTTTPVNNSPACVGGTVNFDPVATGTGTITYTWTGPLGFTSSVATPVLNGATLASDGVYSVTVSTRGAGCTASATTAVTINPTPTTTPVNNSPVCVGGNINLDAVATGTGSLSYSWSGPSGFSSTLAAPAMSSVTTANAGTYSVTVSTSGSGCIATNTTTVTVNPLPSFTPTNTSPLCVGGLVRLDATAAGPGSYSYSWAGPAGFTSSLANPGISGVTLLHDGIYSVTVTNNSTGCNSTATTTVTVNPIPITNPTNTSPACVGGNISFDAVATGTGTISYSWTGPSGFSSTSATPAISSVSPGEAGSYIITVTTSGSGCSATGVTVVSINPAPAASPSNTGPVCSGNMITLHANPSPGSGVTGYSWSGPGGFTSTLANPVVTPSATDNYSLTVSGSGYSGCSPSGVFTTLVSVNPTPSVISAPAFTVCEGLTIAATNALPGGVWSSSNTILATIGSASGVVTGVATGMPYISYVMPTGCYAIQLFTVNPMPSAIAGVTEICEGTSTALSNSVPGGVWNSSDLSIATIDVSTGIVNGILQGTAAISYTLPAGCVVTADVTVDPLPAAITGVTSLCIGSTSTLSSAPGAGTWSSSNTGLATIGSSSGLMTAVAHGSPVITYTLPTGCYSTSVASINSLPTPILGAGAVCAGATMYLSNVTPGGAWSTGDVSVASIDAGTGMVSALSAGTANITYTLSSGCFVTDVVTVNVMAGPVSGTSGGCLGFTTTLSSSPSGGAWSSSNPAMATIDASTGFVATVSTGYPIMTYTLSDGCYITQVVSIDPMPASIAGTTALCAGWLTALSDATPGGTWSSASPGVASIDPISGIVTAVGVGTADITYSLPSGCNAATTVTVYALPGSITGTLAGCLGFSSTLNNSVSGGVWTSSNPALATIGSTSGVVSTIAAGSPTISYMLPAGCFTTAELTINMVPAAIGGSNTVCSGSITTLTDVTGGGTWSSTDPAVAAIGSTTGIVTGLSAGSVSISYILSNGCGVEHTVTVDALPAAISGTLVVCEGLTTTLSSTPGGGTWSSNNPGVATIGSGTGEVTGISAGTTEITYDAGGCTTVTTVTVNPIPAAITGAFTLCESNTTLLSDATPGGTWTSGSSGVAVIDPVTGVVAGVTAGSSDITYSLPTGCINSATITVNAIPTTITGTLYMCEGGTTALASSPDGGLWSSSNILVADVGSAGSVSGILTGIAEVTYSLGTGCITTTEVTVNPLPSAITGLTDVCTGLTIVLSDPTGGGTWTSSNSSIALADPASGVVTGIAPGLPYITYTLPTGCFTSINITVNETPAAIGGVTNVCVNGNIALSSTTSGGTWSCSTPSQAVIDIAGVVTGISDGTPMITYAMPTGCNVTTQITVNPLPDAITGSANVCEGSITTLSSATTGGSWATSDISLAMVDGAGIVLGVAAGIPVMTYTLPTGCLTTIPVTVNSTPASLTGTMNVCPGFTTTLSSLTSGGTWSSSNPALATVDPAGVVSGVAAGTPAISYVLATGCFTTTDVTVNSLPAAIGGTLSVCAGLTTSLNNATPGGTWASSDLAMALIDPATGVATGIAAGTPVISYTLPTGCYTTALLSVNSTPDVITGTTVVCPGSTTILSDAMGGGTWSSSNPAIATVGSSTGIVAGIAAGVADITYALSAGCVATTPVTVNAAPDITLFTLPVATSPCTGANSTVTVTSSSLGSGTFDVTYDLSGANNSVANTASLVMGLSSGTFDIPSSLLTTSGSTTVTITNITNGLGCTTALTSGNVAVFNVNALPTVYTVGGGGGYCSGGSGVHVMLSGSMVGTNYQLMLSGSPTGAPVAGTSSPIDFGLQTTAGVYTVGAANVATGCINTMNGSATVTVNPLPVAYTITGGGNYCAGGTGVAVGLSSSQVGVNYQLYIGGTMTGSPVIGIGSNISFGSQTVAGVYSVLATDATSGCSSWMAGSATIAVDPVPTAFTGPTAVCAGTTTTLGSTPSGGTWSSSNSLQAAIGSASGVVSAITAGVPYITYTLASGCYVTAPITVNPLPAAITGAGSVCTGNNITLADATTPGAWSSSNTAQAIVGSTGVVAGVGAGVPTISYILPTGCYATTPVTVNLTPLSITGSSTVCTGNTETLVDATAGGSWSSSNTAVATIGSLTGAVFGGIAGTTTISYTLPTGCATSRTMSVNGTPSAISGIFVLCSGQSTNLSSAPGGGAWSSSNPAIASVGTSGTVTAVSGGTVTITYMVGSGCLVTANVTVNPSPAAITGSSSVCVGYTISLSDVTSGGSWSSSNSLQATVGSTGLVNGIAAGTPTINYTMPTGCMVSYPITVNAAVGAITGTMNVCVNSTVGLSSASPGGNWTSSNPTLASITPVTGVVSGMSSGTAIISYILPTGCYTTANFTVNPLPAAITGTASVCSGRNTALSDATSGGTWNSSNIPVATVGSSSGVVSGVSAGTASINYVLPTGCSSSVVVTVNGTPGAVTGTTGVCVGSSATLTNSMPGGVWTSSNTSLATVGSSTGVVNGLATGVPTIMYSMPLSGCVSTQPITVNPQPSAITGPLSVCVSSTSALTDATGGGIWNSSNTAVAAIGSATGIVSGVSAGTATITYQLPTGCFVTATATANPLPAAIAGASSVCVNSATTLSDATGGGTWSSSNTLLATIGSASGVLTGVGAGILNITYLLPTGCSITTPFTVNALPAAITGTTTVCVNANTTLNDATGGGTWSSSNISVATIGSITGVVTGVTSGSPVFTYTIPTGCYVTAAGVVNPLPAVFTITGGGSYCAGGSGVHVGLNGSSTGVRYQLFNGAGPIGSPVNGTGIALDFGFVTVAGTYTAVATNSLTNCSIAMAGSATVTGNPLPTVFAVTGGGNYCAGGTGVTVGLAGSQPGLNYQLYNGATPMGGPLAGTGAGLSFGLQTAAGAYTVTATNPGTGCNNPMTGSAIIAVNPLPTVFTVSGGGTYCAGSTGVHIWLTNSTTGVNYQLMRGVTSVGSPVGGTGSSLDFGSFTTTGTYTVVATNSTTGCTSNMTGSATISVVALPNVYTLSGGGSYCTGGSGVAIALGSSDVGVNYQLFIGLTSIGSPFAGTGSGLNFGTQTTAGTYTAVATNATTGCSATMSGSATITANPLPATFSVTGGGSYCAGGTGVPVGVSGSQSGVNYQLYRGSTLVSTIAGTGGAFNFASQTVAGTYTVTAINATTGCTAVMTGSTAIYVSPLPTVFTVTGGGGYCTGGGGVSVALSGSQPGVNYELQIDGSPTGSMLAGTGGALSFGLQIAPGNYTVRATDAVSGCATLMSGSANVIINALPLVYTITGGGSYCAGGSGVAIGLSGSQTGVSYQLMNGLILVGSAVPGTGTTISFGLQTAGGVYSVVATNLTTACTNNMAGSATVSLYGLPAVYAVTGGGSFCAGGTGIVIGLAGSQMGVNYQLYNGTSTTGSPVSGSGSPISFGLQSAGGTYTVIATNTGTSCSNNMSGSAVIGVSALPVAYTVTGGGAYCIGGTGIHVGLSNSDPGISYQLYNGSTTTGAPVSGTGWALDFGLQTAPGTYTVVGTDVIWGCVNTMTGSATITSSPLPATFTVTGGGTLCIGGTGVAVNLSGSQTGVSYQLYNGGSAVGAPVAGIGSLINFGLQTSPGNYTVVATNTTSGCTASMTGAAAITVAPLPIIFAMTGGGSYCAGGSGVAVGLTGSESGIAYQLFNGSSTSGSPVWGTGAAISFGLQTSTGTYSVIATNPGTACTANMSGSATVSINTSPVVYTVTGGGGYCSGGTGVPVGISGSASGISYQLYRGATAIGAAVTGTGAAFNFGLQTVAGTYTIVARNIGTGCVANMSGSASVTVNPLPTVYAIAGGGSFCAGGSGVAVSIAGSQTGVNYQLKRGGVATGSPLAGTGSSLNFGLQTTGGSYTVAAINATSGCTANMSGTAVIIVNSLPGAYTMTGGGTYCSGGTGLHVGLSGSQTGVNYQLYRGSAIAGTPRAGSGSTLDFGIMTTAGTYTVVATNATTGCTANMSGTSVITVSPLPSVYTMTGGGAYCSGGTGVTVGLGGSQTGINYQLYRGAAAIGSPLAGTGSTLSFGLQTTAGTYTVIATNAITGCTANMSGTATVSVSTPPTLFNVTGGGSYCTGTGLHVGLGGSQTGVNYRLYRSGSPVGSPMAGTGATLDFGLFVTTGNYTVVATNTSTGCVATMSGSAVIASGVLPTAYNVTGGGSLCTGGSGYAIALSGSQLGVNYQLYRGATAVGSLVAGTGSALNFGTFTTAGGYTVTAVNATTGCNSSMTGSATIQVNPLPTAYTVTGGGSYCAGGSGVHVGLSSSAAGVSYQLKRGGTSVGAPVSGTGSTLDFGLQTIAGTYTVVATNVMTTCVGTMTGSAVVTVNSLPAITGSVYTVAPSSTITLGASPSGGTWVSSALSVATIGLSTGVVTGVSPGTVTITYTATTGCSSTHTVSVTSAGHRGAQMDSIATVVVQAGSNINLWPNPNKGTFTLKGNLGTEDEVIKIEVTDILGQVIYSRIVTATDGELDEQIYLGRAIANGMYLVTVLSPTQKWVFHMVVAE